MTNTGTPARSFDDTAFAAASTTAARALWITVALITLALVTGATCAVLAAPISWAILPLSLLGAGVVASGFFFHALYRMVRS